MTARSAFRLGQGIGALVAIAIVVAACAWGWFLRLTADEATGDVVAWIYDEDAASDEMIDGRVWVEAGEIVGVGVYAETAGDKRVLVGGAIVRDGERGSSLELAFRVPFEAAPLDIVIEVHTTRGATYTVPHHLTVVSRTTSALHRIGKGALALALLAALGVVLFALKRRALRRSGEPSPLWLVPAVVIGGASFVPLLEQATRGHGPWFYVTALVAWTVAGFAIAERLNRRIGLTVYTAVPLLVEMAADDAFRGANITTPIRPIADLENAWSAVGLVVRRAGRDLIVTGPGKRLAVVPVSSSETVGAGPLVVRASDPEFADLLVAAASDVLGELRFA